MCRRRDDQGAVISADGVEVGLKIGLTPRQPREYGERRKFPQPQTVFFVWRNETHRTQ